MSRGISIQIMDRIFRKNVKKHISKWRKGVAFQNGGLESMIISMRERSDEFQLVSRAGAVSAIARVFNGI